MHGKMLKETKEASLVSPRLVFQEDEEPKTRLRAPLVVGPGEALVDVKGVKRALLRVLLWGTETQPASGALGAVEESPSVSCLTA